MASKNVFRSSRQIHPKSPRRALLLERLEGRSLLAGLWQNPIDRLDVDDSGEVSPVDVLIVINELVENRGGFAIRAPEQGNAPPPYLDVNGNDFVEPLDALLVINALNEEPMTESTFVQRFLVDVTTGKVSVSPSSLGGENGGEGESLFAGSTILFHSSPLVDQPGDAGRKAINVSLTNRSGESIGQLPDGTVTGLRAIFGDFENVDAISDLRPKTTVSTLAGSGSTGGTDGATSSASFQTPNGVAVDPSGDIYVVEYAGHRVRKISNGQVTTLAGNGVAGSTDGIGTTARFDYPFAIARNPVDGSFVVTENGGNRIRRVTVDGEVTTIAGTGVAGEANGSGATATFRDPAGVAVANDGTIYVTESVGHRVRKIVKSGANPKLASSYTVSLLAGGAATPPVAGTTDAKGTAARFNNPRGVVVDDEGVLYVLDMGNRRVRRVTSDGQVVTIAGTGVASNVDGPGNTATFNSPRGIALVPGTKTLVVSNQGNQSIRYVTLRQGGSPANAASWIVGTLAGAGATGDDDGPGNVASFATPSGLAVDASHNIFVADSVNQKVRRVTPTNGFFTVGIPNAPVPTEPVRLSNADGVIPIANPVLWSETTPPVRTGQQPYIQYEGALQHGESSPEQAWSFIVPSGVASFEFTVVVEANTRFLAPPFGVSNPGPAGVGSPNNMVRTVAGAAIGGFVNGAATEARFNGMNGIATDRFGNQYVADTNNHSIRRITPDGFVSTVAGVVGKGVGAEDGLGTTARFNFPNGVAVTDDGKTLYVTDSSNHTIRRIQLLNGADPKSAASWLVNTIAGLAVTSGYVDNTTGNLARFNTPMGIAVSSSGVVYVTEYTGNRVRRLQLAGADSSLASNWHVSLVAGSTAGTSGDTNGNGSTARFSNPRQIALDIAGNLYVADSSNYRVRKITPEGDVYTLAGSSYGYADGVGTAAQFGTVYCITVDSAGYVYVGDDTHRIRRISPSGVATTVAGTGSFGDTEGTGDVATFYYPTGISVDAAGSLYVVTGGQYQFDGGGSTTSPGLRIRLIERIFAVGSG